MDLSSFNSLLYDSLTAIRRNELENDMQANDINLTPVDKLGFLLAQIAELTKEADAIKDDLKDAATAGGASVVEGNLFKATVVEANRKVTDWKAIAKVCNIPEDLIIEHTSITAVFSVKTSSR